jgi:hypothetical protein
MELLIGNGKLTSDEMRMENITAEINRRQASLISGINIIGTEYVFCSRRR